MDTNELIIKAYNDVLTAQANVKAAKDAEQEAIRVLKEVNAEEGSGKNYFETEDGWFEARGRTNKKTGEITFLLVDHGEKQPFTSTKSRASKEDKLREKILADLSARGIDVSALDIPSQEQETDGQVVVGATGTDDEIVIEG